MALNAWWDAFPAQRYWMQITDREDLAGPLLSPKLAQFVPGYDLVSQVQPGDRVLHWWTRDGQRALVGWSEVVEHPTVIPEYTWKPRTSEERTTTGWRAALGDLHFFPAPVSLADLLPLLPAMEAVKDSLEQAHGTTYFPFYRYAGDRPTDQHQVRAQQAYFVKFPVELFDVIPGISTARLTEVPDASDVEVIEDFQPSGKKAPAGRPTRSQDPKLRAAIERRSLDVAREYYEVTLKGSEYAEVGKPYDISVRVGGVLRHCEVKGSSLEIGDVELTPNEVEHEQTYSPMDLVVVDKMQVIRDDVTGEVMSAIGGRLRVWSDWAPANEHLRPLKYVYELPPGGTDAA